MATTASGIINKVDQFIGDTSTNSVSQNDRLRAISIAIQEMMGEFGFEHLNATYNIPYFDTVNYYRLDVDLSDILEPVDLRRERGKNTELFVRKNPRELSEEIANSDTENAFGLERVDKDTYLVVSYKSAYEAITLHDCDGIASNGTWTVDTTNSDASTANADTIEFKEGSGSINFDVDVSQSGNDRATLENSTLASVNSTGLENLASVLLWAYVPDVTNFSSITAYWGQDSTNYWSLAATTDIDGTTYSNGWNQVKFDWADAAQTGSPSTSAITYLRVDFNYTSAQADDTDFRLDDIRLVRPETLTLHYQSYYIGQSSGGTNIKEFTATTDRPFYSDMYDFFDNPVAHRASAILFEQMGQYADADRKNNDYARTIRDLKKRFPSSQIKETQSFKLRGIKWS